jgi:hypothetical protein
VDPERIVASLQRSVDPSVKFAYRSKNGHDKNVLQDFFSLFNFDILIHPQSNFSLVPSLIHDFAMVYFPVDAAVDGERVVICQTKLEMNEALMKKLIHR